MFALRGFAKKGGDAVNADFHGFFNKPLKTVDVFGRGYSHAQGVGLRGKGACFSGGQEAGSFGEFGDFAGGKLAFSIHEQELFSDLIAKDLDVVEFFFRKFKWDMLGDVGAVKYVHGVFIITALRVWQFLCFVFALR